MIKVIKDFLKEHEIGLTEFFGLVVEVLRDELIKAHNKHKSNPKTETNGKDPKMAKGSKK